MAVLLKLLRDSGKTIPSLPAKVRSSKCPAARWCAVRVSIDRKLGVAPEVSANKYAVNVRFIEAQHSARSRPRPTTSPSPWPKAGHPDTAPWWYRPQCRRPVPLDHRNRFRPFCSERCKLVDLGRWANEGYRIPAEHGPDGDAQRDERS